MPRRGVDVPGERDHGVRHPVRPVAVADFRHISSIMLLRPVAEEEGMGLLDLGGVVLVLLVLRRDRPMIAAAVEG